jgi:hypothetical protein
MDSASETELYADQNLVISLHQYFTYTLCVYIPVIVVTDDGLWGGIFKKFLLFPLPVAIPSLAHTLVPWPSEVCDTAGSTLSHLRAPSWGLNV